MAKKFILALLMCMAAFFTSCDTGFREVKVYADPNGSVKEQIAYHKCEVHKYEVAMEREKHASLQSLQKRDMSEVRRSNNKIARYQRRIDQHEAAIASLKYQKG